MLDWIVIGLLIVIALFFAKVKHIRHKFFAIGVIILIIFFYVTVSKVIREKNVDITTFNGILIAGKIYFSWLLHAGENVKTVVGNVIKMDWVGNSTG